MPVEPIWRLSVGQYHEMIRTGILTDDDPVELLEGWLIPKMPKNPSHRVATRNTRRALEGCVGPGWYVDSQEPVTLEESEPEPDVMVVRGEAEHYLDRHPGGNDLGLVVEVSDTTLARDPGPKKRAFAQAQIPVYWIVNLLENHVEVYTQPAGTGEQADYQRRQDFAVGDEIPVILDGREVARLPVRALFP